MSSPRREFDAESGATVLELIVVLALVMLVTGVIASAQQSGSRKEVSSFGKIEAFLTAARLRAIRSGQGGVLVVDPGAMTYFDRKVDWDTAKTTVTVNSASGAPSNDSRIVLYADGTASVSAIVVTEDGRTRAIPTPARPLTLHASAP
jgi:Tfp pilus assembly protein FimT